MLWASYPFWLALISIGVAIAERIRPWRPEQRQLRPRLWSDLGHLVVNGHFLGLALYGIYSEWIHARVVAFTTEHGLHDALFAGVASLWPVWLQIVVAVVVADFLQWCVHNLLHRVGPLWQLHKIHHSVVDGEMDWIVAFRFHWLEVVTYKTLLYVPLAFFGFGVEAVMVHAVVGTLIGHLNHSNLDLGHGPWRYVLNSPRMHIWHHDVEGDAKGTKNFGIIFSAWDWIFGTAHMPGPRPKKLGFSGVEEVPPSFVAHAAWPVARPAYFGVAVMAGLYALSLGPHRLTSPPDGNATSRPSREAIAEAIHAPDEARRGLAGLGAAARRAGWARPEAAIEARELAAILGLPELVLLDVRPAARHGEGHIPTARVAERSSYAAASGLSKSGPELAAFLAVNGASPEAVIVLYGDGGAEPYRMWWTLREVLGIEARVLDGGIQAWKKLDLPVADGPASPATIVATSTAVDRRPPGERWADVRAYMEAAATAKVHLLDARTVEEFEGATQDPRAKRAGRIPGAAHLSWSDMLVSLDDPRLLPLDRLAARLDEAGIGRGDRVVTYCQSATRSSVLLYALLQLGMGEDQLVNYGGSWAEYSALDLPVATGR